MKSAVVAIMMGMAMGCGSETASEQRVRSIAAVNPISPGTIYPWVRPENERKQLLTHIKKVIPGMSVPEVTAIMGRPDEVVVVPRMVTTEPDKGFSLKYCLRKVVANPNMEDDYLIVFFDPAGKVDEIVHTVDQRK